jgi:SAM-dependent methyltransferase
MLHTQARVEAFVLACPRCRGALDSSSDTRHAWCPACQVRYERSEGVWRFLSPDRAAVYHRFEREYLIVRRAEGWGSDDPAYYRALPFVNHGGQFGAVWRIRAASFRSLLSTIPVGRPLRILDLGAGNGWLSYQLARHGHAVAAIDLQVDERDGLGASKHYDARFTPMQAEFDHLPLASAQADLAIFNGSLHYSTDCAASLREALRVLEPRGRIAILDSPMYDSVSSGVQMVREREARFLRTYGFASDSLPSEHFLTDQRLADLGNTLSITWRVREPFRGWRRALQPWWARARRQRVPASFPLIIGQRT